ncbi:MAG TPA: hypothetical protein VHB02_06225 [Acidimicrobiales bacterium]|nr:hypothetical protein [Acidimicrobiales bacterium]
MKTYSVTYPTCGEVTVTVEAESEEAAIEAGWDLVGNDDAEHTWEAMRHIVQGNVFHGNRNAIDVILEDDEDR